MEALKATIIALYLCLCMGMTFDLADKVRHKNKEEAIFDSILIICLIIAIILMF